MLRIRAFAARVAAGIVIVIALPASVAVNAPALPACENEDSVTDCYWNADARSNGEGRSFEVRGGIVRYADGETITIPASELESVTR